MARLNIDTGTEGNTATGDTLRTAFTKANTNFIDLYTSIGANNVVINTNTITTNLTNGNVQIIPNGTGVVEIDTLQVNGSTLTALATNDNLTLTANGTGNIVLEGVQIKDNTISSNASNADLQLDASGTGAVAILPVKIMMLNIPSSNPGVAGQVWKNGNDLKVSAG